MQGNPAAETENSGTEGLATREPVPRKGGEQTDEGLDKALAQSVRLLTCGGCAPSHPWGAEVEDLPWGLKVRVRHCRRLVVHQQALRGHSEGSWHPVAGRNISHEASTLLVEDAVVQEFIETGWDVLQRHAVVLIVGVHVCC